MKFKRIYFEQKRRSIKITILKTLLKKYECMSRENNQNHSVSVKFFIRPKRDFKHYFSLIIQKKKISDLNPKPNICKTSLYRQPEQVWLSDQVTLLQISKCSSANKRPIECFLLVYWKSVSNREFWGEDLKFTFERDRQQTKFNFLLDLQLIVVQ